MTRTYEPADTRLWSSVELDRLIGKHATVTINGGSSDGWVEDAGIGMRAIAFIEYRGGGSEEWDRDRDEVRIEVHESDREEDW